MRSKASLGSSREVVQGCGVSFTNCLYLVPLIISQNFCTTHATTNQTGPLDFYGAVCEWPRDSGLSNDGWTYTAHLPRDSAVVQ